MEILAGIILFIICLPFIFFLAFRKYRMLSKRTQILNNARELSKLSWTLAQKYLDEHLPQ